MDSFINEPILLEADSNDDDDDDGAEEEEDDDCGDDVFAFSSLPVSLAAAADALRTEHPWKRKQQQKQQQKKIA